MPPHTQATVRAPRPDSGDLDRRLESHRRELTGYCYRMLGSGFEAEDAVQETFVRAWRNIESLSAPGALRSWLYRIATNVCLDMKQTPQRRARPMDFGPASTADSALPAPLPESTWIQPVPDAWVLSPEADPAELAATRETLKLAFVAALQHLPPKQRAVLILREVLRWKADEVAELLGTTTASVNSALQRARATLEELDLDADATAATDVDDAEKQQLLARYIDTFERYDIAALTQLLHDDAAFTMPPHPLWLRGPEDVGRFMLGPGAACRDSKVFALEANGGPALATYKRAEDGSYAPWAVMLLEVVDGKITEVHNFLYPELFAAFGLPPRIEG